jgi:hypothetical protein
MYLCEDPKTGYLTMLEESPDSGAVFRLGNTHQPSQCSDHPCVIHNTGSLHPLTMEPAFWNAEQGCIERVCYHGVHHPDRDDEAYYISMGHGSRDHDDCDGCCTGSYGS